MDAAVYKLITGYLDDQHSFFKSPGYATGYSARAEFREKMGYGISFKEWNDLHKKYLAERAKYYPDGVPGYEEVGDTAFITFDDFLLGSAEFYEVAPTNDPNDTIGLIAYSVQQILRKDSPVKNVVLDLSCNGGGVIDADIYTVAAFLGKARISNEYTLTGALVTGEYLADTNFDRKFDSNDYLAGKVSFSNGNMVPCMFKASSDVTLIGDTSGGGACTVSGISTAAGTLFKISGNIRSSFIKNGALYDIDLGAEPDICLSKPSSYYDRAKLVEWIDSLL